MCDLSLSWWCLNGSQTDLLPSVLLLKHVLSLPNVLVALCLNCPASWLSMPTSLSPNVMGTQCLFCLFQHLFLQRPTSFLPNILLSKNTEGRYSSLPSRVFHITPFLAVQDSSIGDLVTQSVRPSEIFDNDNSRH